MIGHPRMTRETLLALAERKGRRADRIWENWNLADPRCVKRWRRLVREAEALEARAACLVEGEGK